MATERNANQVPSLTLKSNAGNNADVIGWADPATHRLLVDIGSGGTSGTQYTDGESTPTHPIGNALIFDNAGTMTDVSDVNPLPVSATISTAGLATSAKQDTGNTSLASIDGKITAVNTGAVVVSSSALPTGASTLAEQQSQTTHLATIAGDTTDIEAAVELIDDTVATLGTTTYTEATTKGLVIGAVRRDADTTLVDTTNEVAPFQLDARGFLKTEVFSGETLPVSLTSTTVTGTVAVTQSGTWDEVGINDSGNSITVDNPQLSVVGGGTEAAAMRVTIANDSTGVLSVDDNGGSITVDGTVAVTGVSTLAEQQTQTTHLATIAGDTTDIETAVELIDDAIVADDAAFTPATTKVMMAGFEYDDTTPDSVNEGDAGAARMSANRNVYMTIRDAAGNERGANVNAAGALSIDGSTFVQGVGGEVAHDSADTGNPQKFGYKAYSPDGTTPGTAVAESDRTNAKGDLDGRLFVNDRHPWHWSYHEDSSSALTDASVQADPGDGFQIVITEIMFSTGAATACNIFFEEGSTKVLGPWYLEAVAGRGLFWKGEKFITASTALTVTTSAAVAHGLDISGYIQAV